MKKMKMNVQSAVGQSRSQEMEVDPNMTVDDLLQEVAAINVVDASKISLSKDGKVLPGGATLKQVGLREGDTIHALPHDPRGGR